MSANEEEGNRSSSSSKDGIMKIPTSSSISSSSADSTKLFLSMKANGFFFAGSLLYLPPSVWDLVVTDPLTGNLNRNTQLEHMIYTTMLVFATLFYLCNGLLEMKMAHTAYVASNRSGLDMFMINGGIFTFAALFELIAVSITSHGLIFMGISTCAYVVNSLFTLWLRRYQKPFLGQGSKESLLVVTRAKLIRVGDILFLIGACLDVVSVYIESSGWSKTVAILWVISSSAWLLDAILYLMADKLLLDDEKSREQSTTTMNTEMNNLKEEEEQEGEGRSEEDAEEEVSATAPLSSLI